MNANTCHTLDRNNILADRDICGIMDGDDLNNAVQAVFNVKYHPYVQSDYVAACITDAFLDSPTNVLLVPLNALALAVTATLSTIVILTL